MAKKKASGKNRDPYEVLGVDKKATKADVKRAYRRKAAKLHPDAGGDGEEFRALTIAYETLEDDEKRARFDRVGDAPDDPVESLVAMLARKAFCSDVRDPVAWMLETADRERAERMSQRSIGKQRVEKLRRQRELFLKANEKTKKVDERDTIAAMLDTFILEVEKDLAELEDMIAKSTQVLDYLVGLKYPANEAGVGTVSMRGATFVFGGAEIRFP